MQTYLQHFTLFPYRTNQCNKHMSFLPIPLISYKLIHLNIQISPTTMKPKDQYKIET